MQIHLRAAIDRFLRLLPLNKPFSVSLTPLLLRQINYKSICIRLKTGNIAGVLEPRNGKKPASNEQMKKPFDSGELGRTESKNPAQLQRT